MPHQLHPTSCFNRHVRYITCSAIVILTLLALHPLYLRLMAGIHYLKGNGYLREGLYGLAAGHFKEAAVFQPYDYRIRKKTGESYSRLGESSTYIKEAWPLSLNAKESYISAARLNPLDAEVSYGLARAESRLEQLYSFLYPKSRNNPYSAVPFFKEALRLRPGSITFRYAMARYLFYHKKEGLLPVIRTIARVYPRSYYHLKEEPFWSPAAREAVRQGLDLAIEDKVSPREAHMAISSMLAEEKKWEAAISHYTQALSYRTFENRSGDYIHLGLLDLKNGMVQEAELSFIRGIGMSLSREKDLQRIYNIHKNEDRINEFAGFYHRLCLRYMTTIGMDLILARSMMDLKKYDDARNVLMEINNKEPTAEAYYLLARIAEIEKDWDSTDLLIHRATVLDPDNGNYHMMFSHVLKRLKKLERAEKEVSIALKLENSPSPWTFDHRAWIRWDLKDFVGAARDWGAAIRLKPDHAPFYAQAGEAYIKLAYWPMAADYYEKAFRLDPENKRYKERYLALKDNRD